MKYFRFFIALCFFIFATNVSALPAKTVTISSFSEPFNTVLDNLMTNYWSTDNDGNWLYDESIPDNCAGFDGARFSTEVLYPLGRDTDNSTYIDRANLTVDYVINIASYSALIQAIINNEDISEAAASLPALIYGYQYYSGSSKYPFNIDLTWICNTITPAVKSGTFKIPYSNAYSGPANAAYYLLLLAYAFMEKDDSLQASNFARQAYELLEVSETLWIQTDNNTGYYHDENNGNYAFEWSMMLQTLALAYRASAKEIYRDRFLGLTNYLEDLRDKDYPYGYFRSKYSSVKITSTNGFLTSAFLTFYDATQDPIWFQRAEQTLTFLTGPLLINDVRFPGYSVIGHDWNAYNGTETCSCSGCNFAVLSYIYKYNNLEQEGPQGLDLIPTCAIATATFGTEMTDKINILRDFRDRYLLKNKLGNAFVNTYYKHSPPIADWLSRHKTARKAVSIFLRPIVWVASFFVDQD